MIIGQILNDICVAGVVKLIEGTMRIAHEEMLLVFPFDPSDTVGALVTAINEETGSQCEIVDEGLLDSIESSLIFSTDQCLSY